MLIKFISTGAENRKQPKIPTFISYDSKNTKNFSWGVQKPTHDIKIEAIKLRLDPDQETPLYVPPSDTQAELRRLGKSATEVSADYIKAMYTHALKKIGEKVPAQYLQMCQKTFVLSVPAVWSDRAKNTTLTVFGSILIGYLSMLTSVIPIIGSETSWDRPHHSNQRARSCCIIYRARPQGHVNGRE